ncbi:hypothetical protein EDD91_2149 [Streptomyces sp. KS 21]|nr:hypothetical protein EDD91_2149 [Streptomyces sp. KS 21]
MMSKVVPLCGPADSSSEAARWGASNDPTSKDDAFSNPEDDFPICIDLFLVTQPMECVAILEPIRDDV